jgi:hypothetical protein
LLRAVKKMKSKTEVHPSDSVKDYFEDYCANTSIHGVKYLREKDRSLGER